MKKFFILLLSVFIIGGIVRYKYYYIKHKDIKYTVEKYFTTGILNNYKMCSISAINLSFSNGRIAVVEVEGLDNKSPHRKVAYNAFLEKNDKNLWHVKKVYCLNNELKTR